jgi:uncharacterized protein
MLAGLLPAARADVPEPPETPTAWVTDNAGFLGQATRDSLDRRLSAYAASTGHQVLVWIGQTTGNVPLEQFTAQAFEKWRVGRKGIDDGIILFVFAADRKVRIEVGYGLEDKVPDAIASRIIRETIVPRIRAGDGDGAVVGGVEAIIARVEGKLPPGAEPASGRPRLSPVQAVLLVIGLIVFVGFLATHPALAAFFLMSFFGGGRRGGGGFGGGGGGGGFGGGGGRSGGGGASGSW